MDKIFVGNNIDILKSDAIPKKRVRLVITSPPYPGFKRGIQKAMEKGGGGGYTSGGKNNFEMMEEDAYVVAIIKLLRAIEPHMLEYGTVMFNINSPTDEYYRRKLLSMYVAIKVHEHTNFTFYEHNLWYNICAPTAAFPYRLKPTFEHIFQFQYVPGGEPALKKKYNGKSWQSNIIFNKKDLQVAFETQWDTQKRKLASKQDRQFAQSGHNYEEKGFFKGEGKDLENVFFFANTRNSETEKVKLCLCNSCSNKEFAARKNLSDAHNFDIKEIKEDKVIAECRLCGSDNVEIIGHGAVFPEALCKMLIMGWSNPGDVILDPFMGSGTVGVAAKLFSHANSRQYIGCDINPNYVTLAEEKVRLITKVKQEELF